MDRADIVPVRLALPDPKDRLRNPGAYNTALSVVFSCVGIEQPAAKFCQALMHFTHRASGYTTVGVLSVCPTQCGLFFQDTSIEGIYIALEVAARNTKVKIVWHASLTEDGFWKALSEQPRLEILRSLIASQPV